MNERMLELYRQAQVPHMAIDPSNNMPYETTTFSAEKFAELIVRECIQAVENAGGFNEEYHMNAIKQHFGIEEYYEVTCPRCGAPDGGTSCGLPYCGLITGF